MNAGLIDVLGIATPVIFLALAALFMMAHRELGPFAGLSVGGRWILMGAFGMGVIAFCFKMAVALVMANMPSQAIDPLVALAGSSPMANVDSSVFNDRALAGRYVWEALPETAPAPANNPTTPDKVALGKRLFLETRLSADGTLNCASCHDLYRRAGADGRRSARGIGSAIGTRNAPTVWNAAFQSVMFWDGRATSLEAQATGPIMNPIEMGMPSAAEVERRLNADASYRAEFSRAFGTAGAPIKLDLVAKALAAYERTLITPDTPYDRFVRGDGSALTQQQIRGMARFETIGCTNCHRGAGFSDASLLGGRSALRIFPTNPTPQEVRYDLLADGGATGHPGTRGLWRIPSLRNVALTAPYFHNGSVDSLAEAVRIMAVAQLGATVGSGATAQRVDWWPQERTFVRSERRVVSDQDVADIVAFLESLSSDALVAAMRRSQ